MLRKLGQNYQIALPKEIAKILHIQVNDYLDIHIEDNRIIVEPQMVIPKDQAYFFTSEWQKDEKEADRDIREGRVIKAKNVKELIKKLRS